MLWCFLRTCFTKQYNKNPCSQTPLSFFVYNIATCFLALQFEEGDEAAELEELMEAEHQEDTMNAHAHDDDDDDDEDNIRDEL